MNKEKLILENISYWQDKLEIADWNITTERIYPEQIEYNGEDYFIGISRESDKKKAIIHHDIDLYEEAIVHELLHIRYPLKNEDEIVTLTTKILSKKNEDWIVNKTNEILNQNKDEKKIE